MKLCEYVMTKYYRIGILTILAVLLESCNKNEAEKHNYDTININLDQVGILDYKDHFASIKLVPLETKEESLIAQIDKLYYTDDYIIIFDQKTMNIFLFGADGKFIRKIGSKGNGPDEYSFFNDIQFSQTDSAIYAHERLLNRIYKYDLFGKLLGKSPKSPFGFNSFYKTDQGYWVYSCFEDNNPQKYNLMLLDENLAEIKKGFFPQKEFINVTFLSTFMSNESGRLFFIYPSSNIIYELDQETVIPFAQIDFGDKTMPYDKIVQLKNRDEYDKLLADKKYLGDIFNYKITNHSLFFSFRETGFNIASFTYNCFYNFLTGETNIYKNPFIQSINYPISTLLLYASDDSLIYPMYPMVLSDDSFEIISKTLSDDIQPDSNPILVICKSL
jgi:hypothetical protein